MTLSEQERCQDLDDSECSLRSDCDFSNGRCEGFGNDDYCTSARIRTGAKCEAEEGGCQSNEDCTGQFDVPNVGRVNVVCRDPGLGFNICCPSATAGADSDENCKEAFLQNLGYIPA